MLVITKDIEHMDIHMVMGMGTEEELTMESIVSISIYFLSLTSRKTHNRIQST